MYVHVHVSQSHAVRPFKEGVTLWLQGALEYKPDRRGKKWSDGGGSWCLAAMEKLLEMKVKV